MSQLGSEVIDQGRFAAPCLPKITNRGNAAMASNV
jgi:hypothetical protein